MYTKGRIFVTRWEKGFQIRRRAGGQEEVLVKEAAEEEARRIQSGEIGLGLPYT